MSDSREDRKNLIRQYKEREKQVGVYAIKNKNTGRVFLGKSMNLDVAFNKHRFQLNNKSHPNKALQADWTEQGEDAFEYEIVEMLDEVPDDPAATNRDLDALVELCREQMSETAGASFY